MQVFSPKDSCRLLLPLVPRGRSSSGHAHGVLPPKRSKKEGKRLRADEQFPGWGKEEAEATGLGGAAVTSATLWPVVRALPRVCSAPSVTPRPAAAFPTHLSSPLLQSLVGWCDQQEERLGTLAGCAWRLSTQLRPEQGP